MKLGTCLACGLILGSLTPSSGLCQTAPAATSPTLASCSSGILAPGCSAFMLGDGTKAVSPPVSPDIQGGDPIWELPLPVAPPTAQSVNIKPYFGDFTAEILDIDEAEGISDGRETSSLRLPLLPKELLVPHSPIPTR